MSARIDLQLVKASQLQEIIFSALRTSKNLSEEDDDYIENSLANYSWIEVDYQKAVSVVYRELYYRCSKDLVITDKESDLIKHVTRLLNLSDEVVAALDYEVGLMFYKRAFRQAVSDGDVTEDEHQDLGKIARFFDLKKVDIRKSVSQLALSHYAFLLSSALKDGELSQAERAKLASVVSRYGLTKKQLSTLSVPNKREILSSALGSIKARGKIQEDDYEEIKELAQFLNAKDLLKPCLKDLELYARVFEIQQGRLPVIADHNFILTAGEKLHFALAVIYQKKLSGKLRKQSGTLYLGSRRLRFVGMHKSHEIRYKNILELKFHHLKTPKISLSVSSGSGGGDYKTSGKGDPGELFEIQEAIRYLIRKANGLEKSAARDTRYIPDEIRSEIWCRDGGKCVICGADSYLEFDHIIPLSKGGATSIDNLQILCRKCNSEKQDNI